MTEKQKRGFALLTPEQRKAMSSMGGKSRDPESRHFFKDKENARKAGQLGGKARWKEKTDGVV